MRYVNKRAVAEDIGRKILDTYMQPGKALPELMEMVNSKSIDVIRNFSEACRNEFESLSATEI